MPFHENLVLIIVNLSLLPFHRFNALNTHNFTTLPWWETHQFNPNLSHRKDITLGSIWIRIPIIPSILRCFDHHPSCFSKGRQVATKKFDVAAGGWTTITVVLIASCPTIERLNFRGNRGKSWFCLVLDGDDDDVYDASDAAGATNHD